MLTLISVPIETLACDFVWCRELPMSDSQMVIETGYDEFHRRYGW